MHFRHLSYICAMDFSQNKSYSVQEAKNKLMQYCAYQDRCHQEVEEKLKEMRMIPEACEQIIIYLIHENFLNEERFAQSFARGKFRIKKWGRTRIIRELKQRQISKYNINTALKEIDDIEYAKTFLEVADKKLSSIKESNILKRKRKLRDHLLSKGYESTLIYDYLSQLS